MKASFILWISQIIDNKENQKYILKIEKDTNLKLYPYKELDNLLDKMKKKEFQQYIIIVSGRIFPQYIDKIINNKDLYSIPLTIIFTSKKASLKKNIEKKYSKYLEDKYYNILGITDTYKELIFKMLNYSNIINKKISNIILGLTPKPKSYENCVTFQYIKDGSELIFSYLYQKIMSEIKVDYDSIKNFNLYLINNYGKYKYVKELLEIFFLCENIPNFIVAKYWGRIYSLETSFYHNLNYYLMQLKNQDYNTFIQIFYEGFKDLSYKSEILYIEV